MRTKTELWRHAPCIAPPPIAHPDARLTCACLLSCSRLPQDPALEDPREFFETVDEAAAAEKAARGYRAKVPSSMAPSGVGANKGPPGAAARLDESSIEWQGEWS